MIHFFLTKGVVRARLMSMIIVCLFACVVVYVYLAHGR